MTYLQKNNKARKRRIHNLIMIVVALIIVIEIFFGPIKKTLSLVSKPIEGIKSGIVLTFEGVGSIFVSKPKLQEENRLLSEKINMLELELERTSLYQQENRALRDILEIKEESPNNIVAQVIAHPPATDYDSLLIRVGDWKESVFVGMPVFYGAIYIGNIEEMQADTALVRLVTSDKLSQEVYVGEKTILLSGKGGGTFEVTVPKGFDIEVGQVISHVNYPTQPFAVVEHIEADDVQAIQKVYLRVPFSLHSLRYVNF